MSIANCFNCNKIIWEVAGEMVDPRDICDCSPMTLRDVREKLLAGFLSMFSLEEVIREKNYVALEAFCLHKTHQQVLDQAEKEGVDMEELKEMLRKIS